MISTLRAALLPLTLALAFMLATALVWATNAQTQPRQADRFKELQILGVNDFHGNLESPRSLPRGPDQVPVGGAAYLDAHLQEAAAQNPRGTIRVHAGDMVGATPLISSYFHDEPTVYAMNAMGFDVGTLGNHEFDEGGEEMLRLLRGGQRDDEEQFKDGADGQPVNTSDPDFPGADFPYVSANTVYADSGENVLRPYRVLERKGVKVGFIGVTTDDTPNIVTAEEIAPFRFLDLSQTVNKYVKELRRKDVETIVVLAHEGAMQSTSGDTATGKIIDETKQMNDNVDVVVAGHSHSKLDNCIDDETDKVRPGERRLENGTIVDAPCGKDKLVVEAFSAGTAYDAIQMKVNRRTNDVASSSAGVITTYQDEVTPDPQTQAIVDEYKAKITPISERVVSNAGQNISRNDNPGEESSLGALIADAQRAFPAEQGSAPADFAFMNPGGIRADIEQGPVTYGELFTVQPFDNQVVTMDLTGAQIYTLLDQQFPPNQAGSTVRILQVSGLSYTYDSNAPQGERITNLTNTKGTPDTSDDAPIENTDGTTYRIAVNSFIASGGDSFSVLKQGQNVETIGSDLDALEAYIDDEATFGPPADALTRITNATTTP